MSFDVFDDTTTESARKGNSKCQAELQTVVVEEVIVAGVVSVTVVEEEVIVPAVGVVVVVIAVAVVGVTSTPPRPQASPPLT